MAGETVIFPEGNRFSFFIYNCMKLELNQSDEAQQA